MAAQPRTRSPGRASTDAPACTGPEYDHQSGRCTHTTRLEHEFERGNTTPSETRGHGLFRFPFPDGWGPRAEGHRVVREHACHGDRHVWILRQYVFHH